MPCRSSSRSTASSFSATRCSSSPRSGTSSSKPVLPLTKPYPLSITPARSPVAFIPVPAQPPRR
ncbi:hypothetical protein K7G98_10595 [Saccharothrix sp. MB29]|nr:hypothetical protein [Saccharothrix sp. MB29]